MFWHGPLYNGQGTRSLTRNWVTIFMTFTTNLFFKKTGPLRLGTPKFHRSPLVIWIFVPDFNRAPSVTFSLISKRPVPLDPDKDDVDDLQNMLNSISDLEKRQRFVERNEVLRVLRNRERLSSNTWMIERYTSALENTEWPREALQRVENAFPKKDLSMHSETDRAAKKRKSQISVAELKESSRLTGSTSPSVSAKAARKKIKSKANDRTKTAKARSAVDSNSASTSGRPTRRSARINSLMVSVQEAEERE